MTGFIYLCVFDLFASCCVCFAKYFVTVAAVWVQITSVELKAYTCIKVVWLLKVNPGLPANQEPDLSIYLNTTTWSKISAWSWHLRILGFNPSYCCGIVANLLHTCNPPWSRNINLVVSCLSTTFQAGKDCSVRYLASMCVCACVCVHISVFMICAVYVWEEATACTNVSWPNTWLSECLPEVGGQILW